MNNERVAFNRRRFFECLSAVGLGSTLMPEALMLAAQDAETVTVEMLEVAQKIARVSFTRTIGNISGVSRRLTETASRTLGPPDAAGDATASPCYPEMAYLIVRGSTVRPSSRPSSRLA